jgi:hypothetical protein
MRIYMYTPIWSNQSVSSSGSDIEGGIDEEVLASSREREAVYLDVSRSLEQDLMLLRLSLGDGELRLLCL